MAIGARRSAEAIWDELYSHHGKSSLRSNQQDMKYGRYETQDMSSGSTEHKNMSSERNHHQDLTSGRYGQQDITGQDKMSSCSSGTLVTESTFLANVPHHLLSDPDIQEMTAKFRKETEIHLRLTREVKEKQERLEKLCAIVKI